MGGIRRSAPRQCSRSAIAVSNETLKAAEARFEAARAAVRGARSALFPQVSAPSVDRPCAAVRQPRRRRRFTTSTATSCCRWTCRTKPTSGAAFAVRSTSSRRHRAGHRRRSRVAVAWPACRARDRLLHRCAGLDREKALLDTTVTAYAQRARADAESFPRRHRVAGRCRAGADAARNDPRPGRGRRRDARRARARDRHPGRPTGVGVLGDDVAAGRLAARRAGRCPVRTSRTASRHRRRGAPRRRRQRAGRRRERRTLPHPHALGAAGFEASSFGSWLASASNFWSIGACAARQRVRCGRTPGGPGRGARRLHADGRGLSARRCCRRFRKSKISWRR